MATRSKASRRRRKRAKPLRRIIDPELAKMLSHEVRGHILATLGERTASPSEIAKEIGEPVMEVSYHFRELRARDLIRLARTERRRGFQEHFYELSTHVAHLDAGRSLMVLDERGRQEMRELMEQTMDRILRIREGSAGRAKGSAAGLSMEIFLVAYETGGGPHRPKRVAGR